MHRDRDLAVADLAGRARVHGRVGIGSAVEEERLARLRRIPALRYGTAAEQAERALRQRFGGATRVPTDNTASSGCVRRSRRDTDGAAGRHSPCQSAPSPCSKRSPSTTSSPLPAPDASRSAIS